jgi:hypothetical protein
MKKVFNCGLVLVSAFLINYQSYSQSSNSKYVNSCPCDTAKLYLNPSFKQFAGNFLTSYLDYVRVHSPAVGNQQPFVDAIQNSDQEEETVSAIYSKYAVNFDSAMIYKNQMDNSILRVLHDFPILMDLDENEVWKIITNALDLGMKSTDSEWLSIQQIVFNKALALLPRERRIATGSQMTGFIPLLSIAAIQPFYRPVKLALSEVWDCMLEAVGFGSASTFGVGQLIKLAKEEGIETVVVTVSKWLAKKAGWIGAIVMLVDFSICIYNQAMD